MGGWQTTCVPPAGIQVTEIRASAVVPYVERRTVQENKSIDGSQLLCSEQRAPVDERTGSIVRKDDLHQRSEAPGYLGDARLTGRLRHAKPVDQRGRWTSWLSGNEAECSFAWQFIHDYLPCECVVLSEAVRRCLRGLLI
jgi:hypothetical protein